MSVSTEKIGFDQLPEAVATIMKDVQDLKEMVYGHLEQLKPEEPKIWFNIGELCDYLPDKPSKQTVYTWVCYRQIPYHKTGKKLSFLKSEIDAWIAKSARATAQEIRETAQACYGNKKGGRL